MRIVLEKEVTRTLVPEDVELNVTDYSLKITGPDGKTNTFQLKKSSFLMENVPIGQYTIVATGMNSDGTPMVTGSTTFNLSKTNTTATVILQELVGSGDLELVFNWNPDRFSGDATLKLTITGQDNNQSYTHSESYANGTATYTLTSVPSGSYLLFAELYSGSQKIAGVIEAIRIVDGNPTRGTINFNLDKEDGTIGSITLINKAGVPVECVITGLTADTQVAAQKDLEVAFDPGTIDKEDLSITWYLDGIQIGTGLTVTICPEPGTHRLDVVARTTMLASTGSTQVTFEAALLGAVGEPVVAGVITDGEIAIGGRTNFDFLQDGMLIITSDEHKIATIASIVRNSLKAESQTEYTDGVKQVLSITEGNAVAFLHDATRTTSRYTYNPSTITLAQPITDTGRAGKLSTSNPFTGEMLGLVQYSPMPKSQAFYKVVGITDNADYKMASISGRHPTNTNVTASNYSDETSFPIGTTYSLYGQFVVSGSEDYCFTSSYDGTQIAAVIKESGMLYGFRSTTSVGGGYSEAISEAVGATAIGILPSNDADVIRVILAVGDVFRIYDINASSSAKTVTKVGSDITRTGSSFGTTQFIMSHNGEFLYALNTTAGTISTYSVDTSGNLAFVSSTDAGINMTKGVISRNGAYMILTDANGSKLTMLRIRTE